MTTFARTLLALCIAGCQPCRAAPAATPAGGPTAEHAATEPCQGRVMSGPPLGVVFTAPCGRSLGPTLLTHANEVSEYFEPPSELIEHLSAQLRPALEAGRARPETLLSLPTQSEDRAEAAWGVRSALDEILKHFTSYRCQYIGLITRAHARRVLVSCFLAEAQDAYPDWQRRWIGADVDDGGSDFWRIQYDTATGSFFGFDVNASA
jgi:hypothetical protein